MLNKIRKTEERPDSEYAQEPVQLVAQQAPEPVPERKTSDEMITLMAESTLEGGNDRMADPAPESAEEQTAAPAPENAEEQTADLVTENEDAREEFVPEFDEWTDGQAPEFEDETDGIRE